MDKRAALIAEIFEDMLVMRRKMIERHLSGPGDPDIPPAQGRLLHIVDWRGSLSVKEIAEILRVSGSAVTQLVEPLVKAGLLNRESDANDRRTVRINLTEQGKARLKELKRFHLQHWDRILRPLSEPELRSYRDLQRKIIDD
jgi:MarR family transcriptional regulator, organic hydroperoxide resistance regulator